MKARMDIVWIFCFDFEISSTAKILCYKSDTAVISWKLNPEISWLRINIMSNYWSILLIIFELIWLEKILNINFRFKKYYNWPFFSSLLINTLNDFMVNFCIKTFFELNLSVRFGINWWLFIHFLNAESCIEYLLLTITHARKCSCNTKNRRKVWR
jgi:hypothetical protein